MAEKQKTCFFKSSQQMVPPGQIVALRVACPETSHNSAIADASGQTKAGCEFYDDGHKRCMIETAIRYGNEMADKITLRNNDGFFTP